MMLGNMPEQGAVYKDSKLYWRLSIGKRVGHRFFEGGWRGFEFIVMRFNPESLKEGEAYPYSLRIAFAFWFPFELI